MALGDGTLGSGTLGLPLEELPVVDVSAVVTSFTTISVSVSVDGGTVPEPPPISVGVTYPPEQVAVIVKAPNGSRMRFAEDEIDPQNILSDLELSDEIPGGCKELHGMLARNPQLALSDLIPYGEVKAIGLGNESLWEGFTDKGSKVSGENPSVAPSAYGWQYVLNDYQDLKTGYLDSDLSKFGDPPSKRKELLAKAKMTGGNVEVTIGFRDASDTTAAIYLSPTDYEPEKFQTELWYYSGGARIGLVRFDFVVPNPGEMGEKITNQIFCTVIDDIAEGATHSDYHTTAQLNQSLTPPENARYVALLLWVAGFGKKGECAGDTFGWANVKIIGTHEILLEGDWPEVGLYSNQILNHFINTFCSPLWTDEEHLDNDGFLIPQAWYGEGLPAPDIVHDVTKYSLYDWFVYTKKRFEYRKPETYGRKWFASVGSSNLNEVGEDSQELWDEIVVEFQDVDGSQKSIGPPGSDSHYETTALKWSDDSHPAIAAGRTRRQKISLNTVGTPATAELVGIRFLEEANQINHSGSATLSNFVMASDGILHPTSHVKSGDWISFTDAHDTSYRKIVNKSYSARDKTAEIDLDAPPDAMEALLERLQVTIPAGVS